jgi:predicted unusual protein kinase regulating ubiquinone biosynthesis (AarF/ABC1/UbiB family)
MRRYRDVGMLLVKHARATRARAIDGMTTADSPDPDDLAAATEDARRLACDLEDLGPTFVKLGQLLSTRSDILPEPYVEALGRLQDDVAPFETDAARTTIEAELGGPVDQLFEHFEPAPVAAASLGQVYRGRLAGGRPVAVKVQRPGVREQVAADLEAIREIAAFVDRHSDAGRRFGLLRMVEQFQQSMLAELDYLQEAANLEQIRLNLAGFDRLVVPAPVMSATTSRVLTMELVSGARLGERTVTDGEALAQQLFAAYLKQVLVDGVFHADPHPGNIFVTDDGRLALLDLGMVARLGESTQDSLVQLLLSLGDGDADRAADAMIRLGEPRDDIDFDDAAFRPRVAAIIAQHEGLSVGELSGGRVLSGLARAAADAGLPPTPELSMLARALLHLEAVARQLDPEFDPAAAIRAHARDIVTERVRSGMSAAQLYEAAMEAKQFAEKLPRRVNELVDSLARGKFTIRIEGIDSHEVINGMQRLANRVTMGLVLAALIIGAAMLMRVDTATRLFGYPAIAIVCFLAAAAAGVALLVTIVVGDRRRQ